MDELVFYNKYGKPIAYLSESNSDTIYLWDGTPTSYLYKDNIYGFNGKHLGWL